MIHAAAQIGLPRCFFSFSFSVCVYRDTEPGEPTLDEAYVEACRTLNPMELLGFNPWLMGQSIRKLRKAEQL